MRALGTRHLDRQRNLEPRAYLADPHSFGRRLDVAPAEPVGGDPVSQRVALLQHSLVVAWRERGRRPTSGELCAHYGFSRQLWSRVVLGERWAGETVLAALVEAAVIRANAEARRRRPPLG